MEPVEAEMKFGRQLEPVVVSVLGSVADVNHWIARLVRQAEVDGSATQRLTHHSFAIYPRAVND
jgi:hypothetical protein